MGRFLSTLIAATLLSTAVSRAHGDLVTTYQFDNTFAALEANRPAIVAIDPLLQSSFVDAVVFGQTRRVYRFDGNSTVGQQAGLRLDTTPVGPPTPLAPANNYSIEMVFSFDQATGYRRVLNADESTNDFGVYVNTSSKLELFSSAIENGADTFAANTFQHVIITNQPTGGLNHVKLYLNGVLQDTNSTNGPTPGFNGVLSNAMNITNANGELLFFVDNGTEYSDGHVALVRLYDSVLTQSQVTQQAANPFTAVPEPGTWSLLACAAAVAAGTRSRRWLAQARCWLSTSRSRALPLPAPSSGSRT